MAGKNTSVMAIFADQMSVSNAVDHLKQEGFNSSDVAVLLADNQGTREFAHQKDTKAPEGATTGAATGAVIGGALGWLAGIGAIAIPGVGPFIAAGPILAAIAGLGAGGAVGGLAGGLIGLGIPEYEAKRFEGMIKEGKALLSVHCRSSEAVKKAKDILEACGGTDIASRAEASAPNTTDTYNRDVIPATASTSYATPRSDIKPTDIQPGM